MTDTETRTNYTQGLRQLADLLDANPDLPLPYERGVMFFVHHDLVPALAIRDLMVVPVTSHSTSVTFPVDINGTLCGLPAHVYVSADAADVSPEAPRPPCDPRLGLNAPEKTVRGVIDGKTYSVQRPS